MHHTAECSIAAHWKYKLGLTKSSPSSKAGLGPSNAIADTVDSTELVRTIKTDLAPEEVFVAAEGDVISLPYPSSTVIRFCLRDP